jgi:hypothetical protein
MDAIHAIELDRKPVEHAAGAGVSLRLSPPFRSPAQRYAPGQGPLSPTSLDAARVAASPCAPMASPHNTSSPGS